MKLLAGKLVGLQKPLKKTDFLDEIGYLPNEYGRKQLFI
jgi:hypothetical protein